MRVRQIPIYRCSIGNHKQRTVIAQCLVDNDDFESLNKYIWYLDSNTYVVRYEWVNKKRRVIFIHRQIMGLNHGDKREVDHRNRIRTDNRRVNLRIADDTINARNVSPRVGGTSKYRGVYWNTQHGRWLASATVNGKTYHIGLFDNEDEAGEAAKQWRLENMPGALA